MSGSKDDPAARAEIDAKLAELRYYPLDRAWRPPEADTLAHMQVEAGCTLAPDYVAFLRGYGPGGLGAGGFAPLPQGCPIGARFNLDMFYGVSSRDSWNPFHLAATTYEGRLGAGFFPIATDPGGNLLVCACGSGAIFAWDHEHRELSPADLDRVDASAKASGMDTSRYDLGRLITFWEGQNRTAVQSPTGHGNLYQVAGSFTELLKTLTPS